MTDRTRLIDQNDGTVIRLPNVESTVVGLSVEDKLVAFGTDAMDTSIVLPLCHLHRSPDGHWLYPSPDIPTVVNDQPINSEILLSQGSIIEVGDRSIQYRYKIRNSGRDSNCCRRESLKPPPKPNRNTTQQDSDRNYSHGDDTCHHSEDGDDCSMKSDDTDEFLNCSSEDELSRSLAVEVFDRLNRHAGEVDPELLQHLSSQEQVKELTFLELSTVVASLVVQQAVLATDLQLSAYQIDTLFKSFQTEVSVLHRNLYFTFVENFKNSTAHGEQIALTDIHAPIITLLTELLRITPFPVDHVVLWLSLLGSLSHQPENIDTLLKEKTAAVVMGCMSAHAHEEALQQHACDILAQLAYHTSVGKHKGPVRESGVELICRAIERHDKDLYVLRPACRALANVTSNYASFATTALEQAETHNIADDSPIQALNLLDFIRDRALSIIEKTAKKYPSDQVIHTETQRVISFYSDLYLTPVMDVPKSEPETPEQNSIQIQTQINARVDDDDSTSRKVTFDLESPITSEEEEEEEEEEDEEEEDEEEEECNISDVRTTSRVRFAEENSDDVDKFQQNSSDSEDNTYPDSDHVREPKKATDSGLVDGDENTLSEEESVEKTNSITSVIKGFVYKLKSQISSESKRKPHERETIAEQTDIDELYDEKAIIPYDEEKVSLCDESAVNGGAEVKNDVENQMTSSQEWDRIQSGNYCKMQIVDAISPTECQTPQTNVSQKANGYVPRYRKRCQDKPERKLRERNFAPKRRWQKSETHSSSDSLSSSMGEDDESKTETNNNELLRESKSMGNLCLDSSSESDRDVSEQKTDATDDSMAQMALSKSEPDLSGLGKKRRRSLVVSDKIKKCIDKLKDASEKSVRRLSVPGRSRKYKLNNDYQSKYGNDHTFLTRPTFKITDESITTEAEERTNEVLNSDAEKLKKQTKGFRRPSIQDIRLPRDISPPRSFSRRLSAPVIAGPRFSHLKVVDTSAPVTQPTRKRNISDAEIGNTVLQENAFEVLNHEEPEKVTVSKARRKGISGAMKGYLKNLRSSRSDVNLTSIRRSSLVDGLVTEEDELNRGDTLNSNNNNHLDAYSTKAAEQIFSEISNTSTYIKASYFQNHSLYESTHVDEDEYTDNSGHQAVYSGGLTESDLTTHKENWTKVMAEIKIKALLRKASSDKHNLTEAASSPSLTDSSCVAADTDCVTDSQKDCLAPSHDDVMAFVTTTGQVLQQLSLLLCHAQPMSPAQLTTTLRYAVATTDLTITPSHIDPFMLSSRPSLGLSMLAMVTKRPMSSGSSLWTLQSVGDHLDLLDDVRLRTTACKLMYEFITGPLAENIQSGWGYFTLRRLQNNLEKLLQDACDEACADAHHVTYREHLTTLLKHLNKFLNFT